MAAAAERPSFGDPTLRLVGHYDGTPPQLETLRIKDAARERAPAGMDTALLAYSGISVKMLVDRGFGDDHVTMFTVDYDTLHVLRDRLTPDAAIVLFGGQAKDTPYPGSTTVSTVNGGVEGLTRSLVHELKPIRVNVVHPGIVGNSPYWETRQGALEATLARTPTGRLTTMDDIVDATLFLLKNPAMNGVYLKVDGGLHAN